MRSHHLCHLLGAATVAALIGLPASAFTAAPASAALVPHSQPLSQCSSVGATLNVSSAAAVSNGSGGSLGASGVTSLIATLGGGSICALNPSSAVASKLKAIGALYRTNRSEAHDELLALLHDSSSPSPHLVAQLRVVGAAVELPMLTTPCPSLSAKESLSGAVQTANDLAAEAVAKGASDDSGMTEAADEASSSFESFAQGANPQTVGDYLALLQAAQLLGLENTESGQALINSWTGGLQHAADAAVAKAKAGVDPCHATPGQADCIAQAVAVAVAVGGSASPDEALPSTACPGNWVLTAYINLHYTNGGTYSDGCSSPGVTFRRRRG